MALVPNRATPEGQELGAYLVRMTEPVIAQLVTEGEPDTRCSSCAFRLGTVPNGCPQTQMDAIKAVCEGVLFMCHMSPGQQTDCHGWFAARVALTGKTRAMPWDFSPEPEEPPHAPGPHAPGLHSPPVCAACLARRRVSRGHG